MNQICSETTSAQMTAAARTLVERSKFVIRNENLTTEEKIGYILALAQVADYMPHSIPPSEQLPYIRKAVREELKNKF